MRSDLPLNQANPQAHPYVTPVTQSQSLCELERNRTAVIARIASPATPEQRQLVLRLIEIGFLPGEKVRVVAHGRPGFEPIAVRLGHTTFALRRHEAALIQLEPSA